LLPVLQLINCLPYLCHLGKGQAEIILSRKNISEVLENPNTSSNAKDKLRLIQKAREFAVGQVGLNPKGGFEYFTQLDRDEIGWHVTASYPLKFQSYTWWFPMVGKVPYKGFFDKQKALEEEQKLIEEGFDTKLRITAGYSTLGWFSDPVMSPQLRVRDDELVALVIHEMAHATVYFEGDSIFNESYASFVEEAGTVEYYHKFGEEQTNQVLENRKQIKKENGLVMSFVRQVAQELKQLYDMDITDAEKLQKKQEIIMAFKERVILMSGQFQKFDVERFKKAKFNNENFIGLLRYHTGMAFFKNKFQEMGNDFPKFHEEMRKLKTLKKEERENLLKEAEVSTEPVL
jgi:predicted aminopeptidase